ncbi:MAG: glycosyltransferase [Caldilineaceae bacterium]
MQRILILMSRTGGGHKASAEALKLGFEQQFPGRFQIDTVDLLIDHLVPPLNQLPKTYGVVANRMQWLWRMLWATGNYPSATRRLMDELAWLSEKKVTRLFAHRAPDLIVSVHPLVHELTFRALRRLGRPIPVATVVTDLASTHPLWFHPQVRACYVASDAAYFHALASGLWPDQVHKLGLPVRPSFATAAVASSTTLRSQLQMHPTLPAALLMGGGDGIGPVAEIAHQVARRLSITGKPQGQLTVITGRNHSLYEQLAARPWPIPTQILGFVDNVAEWMMASDCLITKAGPGTIAEAAICGLPLLLSDFIPGQEEGNIPFVVENGVGLFLHEPAAIGAQVRRWFTTDRDQLQQMRQQAKRLGRPQATVQIVTSLADLLTHPTPTTLYPQIRTLPPLRTRRKQPLRL